MRDLIALAKPSIVWLSVLMALLGIWLAPGAVDWLDATLMLIGTGLIVGSANALNMYMERDVDGRMNRTKDRPLPTGRMRPVTALVFGSVIGLVGIVMLYLWGNPITAGLGYIALVSYVLIYTPLKRKTPQALLVGAIPGAMPPLMGWTMATGTIPVGAEPSVVLETSSPPTTRAEAAPPNPFRSATI